MWKASRTTRSANSWEWRRARRRPRSREHGIPCGAHSAKEYRMHPDHDIPEYDDETQRLLAELPRAAAVMPGEADRIVAQLRDEGFFRRRSNRVVRLTLQAAAAAA